MREIKFRYRYTKGHDWIMRTFTLEQILNGEPFEVLSDEPLLRSYKMVGEDQFTGLLDKNNKEIYEGDLVAIDGWSDNPYVVGFNRGGFCFYKTEADDYYHDCKYLEKCEVVGDIYRNPELLNP